MRTGDAETICRAYAPDAVVFTLAPPLVQPPDGNRDITQLQAWFKEKGGSVWVEVRDLQVAVETLSGASSTNPHPRRFTWTTPSGPRPSRSPDRPTALTRGSRNHKP